MTIYKYPIKITDSQKVKLPLNAEILTVQMQGETLCLWAKVEEVGNTSTEERTIEVFGTGHPMSDDARRYIGTIQIHVGALWHVFERE